MLLSWKEGKPRHLTSPSMRVRIFPWNIPGLWQSSDSIVPWNSRSLNSCSLTSLGKRSNTLRDSHAVPSDWVKGNSYQFRWQRLKQSLQNSSKNLYLDVISLLNIDMHIYLCEIRSLSNKIVQFISLSFDSLLWLHKIIHFCFQEEVFSTSLKVHENKKECFE